MMSLELAISWLMESQSLPKGAGGGDVLKLGAAEMVHQSVCGLFLFSGYFADRFLRAGKKEKNWQET
jgi:hypothetical protein